MADPSESTPLKAESEAKPEEVELQEKKEDVAPESEEEESGGSGPTFTLHEGDKDVVYDGVEALCAKFQTDSTKGLTGAQVTALQAEFGPNEVPEVEVAWYCRLAGQFTFPLAIIIELAGVLALIVAAVGDATEWRDVIIIGLLVLMNAFVGFYEEQKAHLAMMALKNTVKQSCNCTRDGISTLMETKDLVPGDLVLVKGGMLVPADCYMVEGVEMSVDNSSLTGESRMIKMKPGSMLLAGGTVKSGDGYVIVHLTGANTMIGDAQEKMGEGSPKGGFQKSLELAVNTLVLITLVDCFWIVSIDVMIHDTDVLDAISVIVSLLIASVPVALPMVMTVTLAMGAHNMSEHKAIVTHLEALQDISSMDVLCSDKTGTLTTAELEIYFDEIVCEEGFSKEDVMMWAGVASNPDDANDAVDKGIFLGYDKHFKLEPVDGHTTRPQLAAYKKTKAVPFSAVVKRVVVYCNKDGIKYRVAKGIMSKIMKTGEDGGDTFECHDYENLKGRCTKVSDDMTENAFKIIAVAVENITEGSGMKFAGLIPMRDPPRHDTAEVIENVNKSCVRVKMITGDHLDIAIKTAEQIGLGKNIYAATELHGPGGDALIEMADGFAQVLPVDKYNVVRSLQEQGGHTVGMTGDGVNDAAALARANIGIAVADATDAARRAADIILTAGGLGAIFFAIQESRRIFKRLNSYLVYRLGSSIFLVLQISLMFYIWAFNVQTFGIILLALFCDLAVIFIGRDIQHAGLIPTKPDLKKLLTFSALYGLVLTFQGIWWFIFLGHTYGYKSYDQQGVPLVKGLPDFTGYSPEEAALAQHNHENLSSAMFLEMGASCLIAIFPARTKGPFFLSCPDPCILVSVILFCIFTTVLVLPASAGSPLIWPLFQTPTVDGNDVIGFTWLYVIVWMFILDLVKMGAHFALEPHVYRSNTEGGGGCRCHCWGCEGMCGHDGAIAKGSEADNEKHQNKRLAGPRTMTKSQSFAPDYNDNLRGDF